MRCIQILWAVLLLFCTAQNVGADGTEPAGSYTYFLRVLKDAPPLSVVANSNYTARPLTLMRLQSGDIIRAQLSDDDFEKHFSANSSHEGQWIQLNSGAREQLKVWAQPRDLVWVDAYRSKLLLKPKQGDAHVFASPDLKSWRTCIELSEACLNLSAKNSAMEMVDSKIVASEAAGAWEVIYKIHYHEAGGILRDGWVRAAEVEQSKVLGVTDSRAPAMVNDLLSARMDRAQTIEGYVPPPPVTAKYHLDTTAELASFGLNSEDGAHVMQNNMGSGARIGLQFQAPLLYDFSTNLFTHYGQVLKAGEGSSNRYSQFVFGDEILYGVDSTEAHFKIGPGINALLLNNAPVASFRTLGGGYLAFIYEAEDFFASYRGGLVANTSSGISFSNFEILASAGWRLEKQRHGWSVVATYGLTQAHLPTAPDRMKFTVWTLGLSTGI